LQLRSRSLGFDFAAITVDGYPRRRRGTIGFFRMDIVANDGLPQLFAIVASQRSGTHLLREILNSNPHVAIVAEPLSLDDRRATWHHFLRSRAADQQPLATSWEAALLFDQFVREIPQEVGDNCNHFGGRKQTPTLIGLDVKYNQFKCVSPLFTDLRSKPFLIDYFSSRQIRVVHLTRKNLLHVAISLIVSNNRKVWQNCDGSVLPGKYQIPVDELFGYINWVRQERREFERLSQGLDVTACDYDDVVDDIKHADANGFIREASNALSGLAGFLGVPNRFSFNRYIQKVINRPYCEIIENYHEVADAVRHSEYSEFAETI
jgi:LPS sulfotransferase NodH